MMCWTPLVSLAVVSVLAAKSKADTLSQNGSDVSPFAVASYYSSHMVLQMAPQAASIWGYAAISDIGKIVGVDLLGMDKMRYLTKVTTGPESTKAVWRVTFKPMNEGGPYTIKASLAGYKDIVIEDVLFGDVWLCSGQSNMQFMISQIYGASYEAAHGADYRDVRLLNVDRVTSDVPLYDLQRIISPWTRPGADADPHWLGFSAVCYLFGKHLYERLRRPIGLIDDTWGGTPVECWSSGRALRKCGLEDKQYDFDAGDGVPTQNTVLWNAMIHPLLNMTIKGAIWYQGEANAAYHMDQYGCSFPAMITDWRQQFNAATEGQVPLDMPFGFVQIGPITKAPYNSYPTIRWHQMGDNLSRLPLPGMFMAVAMDLTDDISPSGSVHIRDKGTVARRLSNAALVTVYSVGSPSAMYLRVTAETEVAVNSKVIEFNSGVQINVRSYDGFEVCCADDYSKCPLNSTVNWIPAPIVKYTSTSVTLEWEKCPNIAAYRYAWQNTPCPYMRCAVYNDYSGDPLPTFTRPYRTTRKVQDHLMKLQQSLLWRKIAL